MKSFKLDSRSCLALQALPLLVVGSKRGLAAIKYLMDIRSVLQVIT